MSYKAITKHGHPNARANGTILEHVFLMSEMLGRALTDLEVVHHRDEDKRNNHPSNLQLFATQAEHVSYHSTKRAKEKALLESGNAEFLKCPFCKEYDDPPNMAVRKTGRAGYHRKCNALWSNTRNETKRQESKFNEPT